MTKSEEFRRIFDKLYLPLSMYALRITDDIHLAHDAVQESMTALWQKMSKEEEIINASSYLYTVCRNKAISILPPDRIGINELDDVSEEEIDTSERDARIWKAIDGLPERMKTIFLMAKRDGMKHKEIAEELGISYKTVENQIASAMMRLKESLGPKPWKVFFLPFI